MMKRSYGWRKAPHDFVAVYHKTAAKVKDRINWVKYVCTVEDQDGVGVCTGFGIGGVLTTFAIWFGVFTEWFSQNWIYNGERAMEGTLDQDAGGIPTDGFKWIVKYGALLYHLWPFKDELDTTYPPSNLMKEAKKWPVKAGIRIVDGVDGIMSALNQVPAVAIGTPWFSKWENVPDGKLPVVTRKDKVAGGHETFLFGYDAPNRVFFGQNSWGTKNFAPDNVNGPGRYIIPFSAFDMFKQLGGYDAEYPKVDWRAAKLIG